MSFQYDGVSTIIKRLLNHKFLYPFSTQSMSRLSPEYPTIDLIIAIF
jgi:hypothetical protein